VKPDLPNSTDLLLRRFQIGNARAMTLIGGLNVIESRDMAMRVAEHFVTVTAKLGINYVFKASFDKANRSSIHSFRGPGLEDGLKILQEVRDHFDLPVLTDFHEAHQAAAVAEVCDIIQIPAFLARQTDLIVAAAQTDAIVQVKKPQFMSPPQIRNVVEKLREAGTRKIILCERGTCFGYDNLVVDILGFHILREVSGGLPLVFDVTHSLQMRDALADASGGRRRQLSELGRAGLAAGLAGLFIEAHPDPDSALCDGPSALPLHQLEPFLAQMKQVDDLVKSMPTLEIR
jgi:2-dehydro-3-deoxyphosphooctonate aldolase (KDO 8-P synthase)